MKGRNKTATARAKRASFLMELITCILCIIFLPMKIDFLVFLFYSILIIAVGEITYRGMLLVYCDKEEMEESKTSVDERKE